MLIPQTAENESGILKAITQRAASRIIRVRLLVAVPAVIVLLLVLMAGVFYWTADAYLSPTLQQQPGALQDFSRDWLFLLSLFVFGGAAIGYILAWSLTRPIQQIIRLSERVASGDLRSQVAVTRQDEMGQLGSSFNYMVSSLHDFIETRNRFILESFSGGLIVTDLNGTVTAVNSAAEKLLDLNSNAVSGKSVREVFATDELADLLKLHERVIWKQETIVDKRLELQTRKGLTRIVVGFTPMLDSSGTIFGVILNIRDQEEMEKFYRNMQQTDRLATMGTFASGLAHEIRNPLGAIKGTAQLLQEDLGDNTRAKDYLNIITKEVNRLDALIREVQTYSQPAVDKTPADINELIDEIVALAKADPKYKEKDFQLEVHNNPLPRIIASKAQMRQALLNIMLNAFDAVHEGGIVKIDVTHEHTQPLPVKLSIANQGPPIPPDNLTRIFEPFFTTKASGTGLGLSIAYQVAANHNGQLIAKSADGWVTFTMRLADSATPSSSIELDN